MKMPGKCTGPKNLHVAGQVQLDYDEDMATCMDYGSMEAELEVQRTIKRTEGFLTAQRRKRRRCRTLRSSSLKAMRRRMS